MFFFRNIFFHFGSVVFDEQQQSENVCAEMSNPAFFQEFNKNFEFFMNFYQFEFSLKIPGGLRGTAGRRLGTFNKALDSFIFNENYSMQRNR